MTKTVTGYSRTQIALHWMVVVLVTFQFVANDSMSNAWRALLDGKPVATDALALLHMAVGLLIMVLMLARFFLRMTRGAPAPPADEARLLQFAAEAVHYAIYALLIALPLLGASAWFLGLEPAGTLHSWLTNILLAAIFLHVAGALFQHVVRRSNVLIRMFRPDPR